MAGGKRPCGDGCHAGKLLTRAMLLKNGADNNSIVSA
jgi:hypothetical protein